MRTFFIGTTPSSSLKNLSGAFSPRFDQYIMKTAICLCGAENASYPPEKPADFLSNSVAGNCIFCFSVLQ